MEKASNERFRSPYAVAVWWLWVLFAVGNLADLAVQGHDHRSLVTATVLLLVTGIVWVTAQRPRILAGTAGLEIVNPLRTHRVGWAAVVKIDATELVRVRCEWPGGHRDLYSWAVRSSRRRQRAAELRSRRRASGRLGGPGVGGFAATGVGRYQPPPPVVDSDRVVSALTERADKARVTAPDSQAVAPVATWSWLAIAAIVVPALVVLIAALV